jgi:hypothetical protein
MRLELAPGLLSCSAWFRVGALVAASSGLWLRCRLVKHLSEARPPAALTHLLSVASLPHAQYHARNVPVLFSESKWIGLSFVNSLQVPGITVLLIFPILDLLVSTRARFGRLAHTAASRPIDLASRLCCVFPMHPQNRGSNPNRLNFCFLEFGVSGWCSQVFVILIPLNYVIEEPQALFVIRALRSAPFGIPLMLAAAVSPLASFAECFRSMLCLFGVRVYGCAAFGLSALCWSHPAPQPHPLLPYSLPMFSWLFVRLQPAGVQRRDRRFPLRAENHGLPHGHPGSFPFFSFLQSAFLFLLSPVPRIVISSCQHFCLVCFRPSPAMLNSPPLSRLAAHPIEQ